MSLKLASSSEKRSIYEIFRSCRLCGASEGYKMPIIQNVIELEDTDLELSQKIKECAQIEVAIDDKMPPLICELCIVKLNDFHSFKSHCKNINNQTRTRLGLPPQKLSSSPVEKRLTQSVKPSQSSETGTSRQSQPSKKAPRTLKMQTRYGRLKNSKPVKSVLSKLTPIKNEIT